MGETFITFISLKQVRNINDLAIPLSETSRKHLIITGRNGSGKTSTFNEISTCLDGRLNEHTHFTSKSLEVLESSEVRIDIVGAYSQSLREGEFIQSSIGASHLSRFLAPDAIRPILPKHPKEISQNAAELFWSYLVFLRAKQSSEFEAGNMVEYDRLKSWFQKFQSILQELTDCPKLELKFRIDDLSFSLNEPGKEPYSINQLSDGYSAVLQIIASLIMLNSVNGITTKFATQGIVLIDEIEAHLHIDLQKKILPFLTKLFPRIQFIVTTHSPFVLNSISNAVICDLEKRIVTEDLHGYSSEAIVESYFGSDKYSDVLKAEVEEYRQLMSVKELSLEQKAHLFRLERMFASLPKYTSPELSLEINKIKLNRH